MKKGLPALNFNCPDRLPTPVLPAALYRIFTSQIDLFPSQDDHMDAHLELLILHKITTCFLKQEACRAPAF